MKNIQLLKLLNYYGININNINRIELDLIKEYDNINNIKYIMNLLFSNVKDHEKNTLAKVLENNILVLLENSHKIHRNILILKNVNNYKFDLKDYFSNISILFLNTDSFKKNLIYLLDIFSMDETINNLNALNIPPEKLSTLDKQGIINYINDFEKGENMTISNIILRNRIIDYARENKIIISKDLFKYNYDQIIKFQNYRNINIDKLFNSKIIYINKNKIKELTKNYDDAPKKNHRPYYLLEMPNYCLRAIPIYSKPYHKCKNEIKIKDGELGYFRLDKSFNIEENDIVEIIYDFDQNKFQDIESLKTNGLIYDLDKHVSENLYYDFELKKQMLLIDNFKVDHPKKIK